MESQNRNDKSKNNALTGKHIKYVEFDDDMEKREREQRPSKSSNFVSNQDSERRKKHKNENNSKQELQHFIKQQQSQI